MLIFKSDLSWIEHIYKDHYVYNYLYFMIYIDYKPGNECNGTERYVKKNLKLKLTNFVPIQKSISTEED